MFNTNDWYVFDGGTIPPKTCDYIMNWAENKWEPATADIKDKLLMKKEWKVDCQTINLILKPE